MTFIFDKNYKNTEQVAEYLPAFLAAFEDVVSEVGYPYNNSFRGRIAGLEGTDRKNEDTAIYLLQTLKSLRELDAKIAAYLADGFELVQSIEGTTKFSRVVHYGYYMGGTGWTEYETARLVRVEGGRVGAILPKHKRSHGHLVIGKVLAKA